MNIFWHICARALMDNIPGLCCQIRKGRSPKRYLQSRQCFADSCELECGQESGQCVWFRWWICETKFSKTAICENLDPRKFSAVWYIINLWLFCELGRLYESSTACVIMWLLWLCGIHHMITWHLYDLRMYYLSTQIKPLALPRACYYVYLSTLTFRHADASYGQFSCC